MKLWKVFQKAFHSFPYPWNFNGLPKNMEIIIFLDGGCQVIRNNFNFLIFIPMGLKEEPQGKPEPGNYSVVFVVVLLTAAIIRAYKDWAKFQHFKRRSHSAKILAEAFERWRKLTCSNKAEVCLSLLCNTPCHTWASSPVLSNKLFEPREAQTRESFTLFQTAQKVFYWNGAHFNCDLADEYSAAASWRRSTCIAGRCGCEYDTRKQQHLSRASRLERTGVEKDSVAARVWQSVSEHALVQIIHLVQAEQRVQTAAQGGGCALREQGWQYILVSTGLLHLATELHHSRHSD